MSLRIPAGTTQRAHVPGPRARGAAQEGDDGRPARHGRGGGAARRSTTPRPRRCSPTPRPRRRSTRGPTCSGARDEDVVAVTTGGPSCRRGPTRTARSSSSRWPPSWPGCTPRPCAATTGWGSSAPAGRPAGGGATRPATSRCSARCSGCRQEEGVNLAGHQADHRAGAAGRRAARPAGRHGPGAAGRPRRRRAGRGLGARVLPARPGAGGPQPGARGVAAQAPRLAPATQSIVNGSYRIRSSGVPATSIRRHGGPDHGGRPADQHVVVGPRAVPGDDVGQRAALGARGRLVLLDHGDDVEPAGCCRTACAARPKS